MGHQNRAWVFTLNNPDSALDFSQMPVVRYAIYQEEIGESGTYHFQGYIELNRALRLAGMKRLIPKAHFEPRRGTREEARDYCRKRDETYLAGPYEYGDWDSGGQGLRKDLTTVFQMLKEGKTDKEVLEAAPGTWMRMHRGIAAARMVLSTPRDWPMTVEYYYGLPGTGKTRKAFQENRNAYWVQRSKSSSGTGWWDSYAGQETVIIDDFYGWLSYDFLLRVLDRYPLMAETKGGQVNFCAKKIIITSNKHPGELYNYSKCNFDALRRRITSFWVFREPIGKRYIYPICCGSSWELFQESIIDFTSPAIRMGPISDNNNVTGRADVTRTTYLTDDG